MTDTKPTIFFEVYPNNAAFDGIMDMPLIYRATGRYNAIDEAQKWGACVYKITCHVITMVPMNRQVIHSECVYAYRQPNGPDPLKGMDRRGLKRQLGLKRWSRPPKKR